MCMFLMTILVYGQYNNVVTLLKGLFNKAPEHLMATPAGGLMKKLYEEPPTGPDTPDATAVKRIFQQNEAAHPEPKTPKLG